MIHELFLFTFYNYWPIFLLCLIVSISHCYIRIIWLWSSLFFLMPYSTVHITLIISNYICPYRTQPLNFLYRVVRDIFIVVFAKSAVVVIISAGWAQPPAHRVAESRWGGVILTALSSPTWDSSEGSVYWSCCWALYLMVGHQYCKLQVLLLFPLGVSVPRWSYSLVF